VSVPPSRVPLSSFEGAARRLYKSGWHSVAELTLALPHSVVQGGLAVQRRDMTPRHVRGTACVDSSLTWVPVGVRALNVPAGGAGTGAMSPWKPQARRRLARGGDQPSSEADLTRGGDRPSSEVGFC
jgi:hypothetical protein